MKNTHKEYHGTWERAGELANYEYNPETEVNPFLHIAIHATIENQIATNTPEDVAIALESLRAKGESHHDAVHRIGTLLMEEILGTMKHKETFDEQRYVQNLRKISTI